MPSVPHRLEVVVGLLLPPACREEVLGDLCEKYTGPWQYVALAMCVVPSVMLSRIRRTTDTYILLTEALLIYGSYLAGTWYTDRTLLTGQWGLVRLAIPTLLNLTLLILDHAWDASPGSWPARIVNGTMIFISVYSFNAIGGCASWLLVGAVEILLRRKANLPQAAIGPALSAGPTVASRIWTSFLPAAAITVLAILLSSSLKPGMVGILVVIILVVLLPKFGKE
jgi:hypothetical protein